MAGRPGCRRSVLVNRPSVSAGGRVSPDGPVPVGCIAAVGHHELQFIDAAQVHIHILGRCLQRDEPLRQAAELLVHNGTRPGLVRFS